MNIEAKMKKKLEIELRRRLIAYVLEQRGLSGCLPSTGKENRHRYKLVDPNSRRIAWAIADLEFEDIEDRALRTSLQQLWDLFLIDPRQNKEGKPWSRKTIDRDLEALQGGECVDLREQSLSRLEELEDMMLIAWAGGDWSEEDYDLLREALSAIDQLQKKFSRAKPAQGRNDDAEHGDRQPEPPVQESSRPLNGTGHTMGAER